jgi:DNA primase large subunit
MDVSILARYPIHPQTSEYLRSKNVTLDDLVTSSAYEQARDAGRRRVMDALVDGEVHERPMGSEVDGIVELLSYVVARIIVSCTADDHLIQRYSLAEAVTIQHRLNDENFNFVLEMADLLGIKAIETSDSRISIHFSDFLKHSSQMRSEEWNLVGQDLMDGRVTINQTRMVRLIQHAVQEKITGELPLTVNDRIIEAFEPAIDAVREEIAKRKAQYEKESYGKVSFLRLPPCMKKLMGMMKKGENVPHVGRFGLTSFLHTIGMRNEEIVGIFSVSPDFNEHLARYQIDHITGKTSGIEYLPPECGTMISRGVCFDADSLCKKKWMTHPLSYYRIKGKKKPKRPSSKNSD